jgi:hypothetical protein
MKVRFVIEQQHNLATFGYRLMGAQFLPLLSVALIRAAHAQHWPYHGVAEGVQMVAHRFTSAWPR